VLSSPPPSYYCSFSRYGEMFGVIRCSAGSGRRSSHRPANDLIESETKFISDGFWSVHLWSHSIESSFECFLFHLDYRGSSRSNGTDGIRRSIENCRRVKMFGSFVIPGRTGCFHKLMKSSRRRSRCASSSSSSSSSFGSGSDDLAFFFLPERRTLGCECRSVRRSIPAGCFTPDIPR
jgi:hypothetical protein